MFLTKSEYDRGVNTFSPEGRLFQVEYAIEAIKLGSTGVGIQTSEGVVLAVEKRITSPLLEPSSIEKILEVDTHIACCMSGLVADARTMINHARVEAQVKNFLFLLFLFISCYCLSFYSHLYLCRVTDSIMMNQ